MYEECPNGCDGFMLFRRNLDAEQNAVIYECLVCEWKKIEYNPFYITAWAVRIEQTIAVIDIVQSLLAHNDTVDFLRPRLKGKSFLSKRDNSWQFTVGNDEYLQGEIDIANQTGNTPVLRTRKLSPIVLFKLFRTEIA